MGLACTFAAISQLVLWTRGVWEGVLMVWGTDKEGSLFSTEAICVKGKISVIHVSVLEGGQK